MNDIYGIYEGEIYRWRCPICDSVHEQEDDPKGDQVGCEYCEWTGQVESV